MTTRLSIRSKPWIEYADALLLLVFLNIISRRIRTSITVRGGTPAISWITSQCSTTFVLESEIALPVFQGDRVVMN